MEQTNQILNLDPGPSQLISAICDEIGLEELLNEQLEWDEQRCNLSPGARLKALIINILCDRQPLCHISEFFQTLDVKMLFGLDVASKDLNEYCIGRALDALYDATPWKVYSTLSISACRKLGLPFSMLHNDTTSYSLYGNYGSDQGTSDECDGLEKAPVRITRGYSKDHQPGLKQIVIGMSVTPERIPILAKVEDGNTEDKGWNLSFIKKLREILSEDDWDQIVYQADSALVTKENLRAIRGSLHFISRLPDTFKLSDSLKEEAWNNEGWQDVGPLKPHKGAASYKIQSFIRDLDGYPYRFVVVYSDHLYGQKEKTFDRNLQKEKDHLKKELKKLEAMAYHCEKDGRKAISAFKTKHSSSYLTYEVELRPEEMTEKRSKRGRPKKDEAANTLTVFRPCLTFLEEDAETVRKEKQRLGTFILITDLVNADKRSDIEILQNYKGQEAAETRFRLLKSPQMVDAFFLKKPSRIEALGIVFVMALLVYGILENRVRESMKKEKEPLVLASRRKVDRPTAQVLLKELKNIRLIYIVSSTSTHCSGYCSRTCSHFTCETSTHSFKSSIPKNLADSRNICVIKRSAEEAIIPSKLHSSAVRYRDVFRFEFHCVSVYVYTAHVHFRNKIIHASAICQLLRHMV